MSEDGCGRSRTSIFFPVFSIGQAKLIIYCLSFYWLWSGQSNSRSSQKVSIIGCDRKGCLGYHFLR
ncbi:hypothetical protein PMI30_04131 [Pseudomonas sp. GM50]|nr:hypothetical protein PMI30_04131 [Pseudomonas sp. GM50]